MGQENACVCSNTHNLLSKNPQQLVYYSQIYDSQFGEVSVYSSSKKPNSFVAKVHMQIQRSKIFNVFQQVQNAQLPYLVSLHAFQITREKYFTGYISQQVTAYWEYYNYFLTEYLKMRSLRQLFFSQSQIWYLIKACCQSFLLFHSHGIVLDFDVRNIVLIPQGKVKIYWHYLQHNNEHLRFYQKTKQKNNDTTKIPQQQPQNHYRKFVNQEDKNDDSFYYSPQEIQAIEKREQTMKIDFEKSNSFRLGMIVLYCITLTNPIKTCYRPWSSISKNKIKIMVYNSLYQNKVQNSTRYSEHLKHLIKMLLLEDPNKRISISCLRNVYEKFMQEEVQLLMGTTQIPLHTQQSSRKIRVQENRSSQQIAKGNRANQISKQSSGNHDSLKNIASSKHIIKGSKSHGTIIEKINQQQILPTFSNGQYYQVQAEMGSNARNVHIQSDFDKFDTKTVKISQNYHKKDK